ncbi:MAG: SUF system NifU family Fe-S cluster assembly protein [Rhodospirillaceae bacterium]|nr:SUF system NifU family Fe-S cluster assembly protein [Rhodospirillaceae bacterium]
MSALAAADNDADDLKALYQEMILEHGKHPRNARLVEHATCTAKGNNPLCGDKLTVTARVLPDGTLEDLAAEGKGCAISIASASMMTEALKGQSVDTARRLFNAVHDLCMGKSDVAAAKALVPDALADQVDRLAALSGVRQFPVRVKCATLPWHTLLSCLDGRGEATTEKTH